MSLQGVAGILLVAVGVYIINMKRMSGEELLAPIKSMAHDRSTQFAFLTLISVALYSIVDKMAVDHITPFMPSRPFGYFGRPFRFVTFV